MTTTDPKTIEILRQQALDRQEQRTAVPESAVGQLTPPALLPSDETTADTHPLAALVTPPTLPRPPRRASSPVSGPRRPAPPEERVPPAPPELLAGFPLEVLSSVDQIIWSVSPDGHLMFLLAGAVERTYGCPPAHFLNRPGRWLEAVPGDDRAALRAALRHLPATDQFTLEHRVETPVGTARWVVTRGQLVRDRDGRPIRVDGSTHDVTARAETDRAGLGVFEALGSVTGAEFVSQAVYRLATTFGSRAAVVAIPDPLHPALARTVAACVDGRLADGFVFPATGEFVRDLLAGGGKCVLASARDHFPGDEFLARLRAEAVIAEPLVDAAGLLLGFVAVVDDRAIRPGGPDIRLVLRAMAPRVAAELVRPIDQRDQVRKLNARVAEATARAERAESRTREADEQLRQARRLETVGRLVAGVAHDFNNLLTVIAGSAELLRDLLPPTDLLRDPANLIADTAQTAAGVARQLVAFGKPSAADPCAVDPNAAVRAVERMLRRLVGDRVDLDVLLAPGVSPIRIDPGQFDQVLLNLVANARDAITEDGTIAIRVAEAVVSPDRPGWPRELPAGTYVALTVSDSGCGMTDEVRARMFDPYFTTKGERGTGIGLATVWEIVGGSGGHIEVESSPEWGTSLRIFWPCAEGTAPPSLQTLPPPARSETILLVQDEEAVRDVAAVALHLAGYRVLEASNGETGEDRARLYAGPIDVLVTDLGLPRRGGRELAARIRAIRPGLKVLFVSGYAPPAGLGDPFLPKPFTPNELLEAVRRVIVSEY
jgi:signal transduction histidine kinase